MLGVFFLAIKINLPLDYYWIYKHQQITVMKLNWWKSAVKRRYHAWQYLNIAILTWPSVGRVPAFILRIGTWIWQFWHGRGWPRFLHSFYLPEYGNSDMVKGGPGSCIPFTYLNMAILTWSMVGQVLASILPTWIWQFLSWPCGPGSYIHFTYLNMAILTWPSVGRVPAFILPTWIWLFWPGRGWAGFLHPFTYLNMAILTWSRVGRAPASRTRPNISRILSISCKTVARITRQQACYFWHSDFITI